MILNNLFEKYEYINCIGNINIDIKGLCSNSKEAKTDYAFIAVKGTSSDGHNYINSAIDNGATAIICEDLPKDINPYITYIQVKDSADALGNIASAYYNYPSENLIIVGVTGTNGKTTIATLLYKMFKKLGYKVGLLSTVCNYCDDIASPSTHTTPDAINLQRLLAQMVEAKCTYAFMEVSSHSIVQKRIAGINFDGGIFTNLTRDHLDYHKTMDEYLKAKKMFFDNLPFTAFAISNADSKCGKIMLQNTQANKYYYSLQSASEFKGKIKELSLDGMLLNINKKDVYLSFIGEFNALNLLAVYAAAYLLRVEIDDILLILSSLKPVDGRLDFLKSDKGYNVVIDYAHTPDALKNVISTLKQIIKPNKGNLITVVGCGGNRDRGKRRIMGIEAYTQSDKSIFTSDNPRNENPTDILNDMLEGLSKEEQNEIIVIEDRRQAIKTACSLAKKGDIVLIAGKGHETYQEINGVKHDFNDKKIALEFI